MTVAEKKLSWDKSFLRIAWEYATHSTCSRKHVGALIVKNGRIIATGFNGTPKGFENCNDKFKNINWKEQPLDSPLSKDHHDFSEKYEVHAEQNALITLIHNGTNCDGATLYTTLSPCTTCAKLITQSGITRVVYEEEYDRDITGLQILRDMGIEVCYIPFFHSTDLGTEEDI